MTTSSPDDAGGRFLQAIAHRDFAGIRASFADDVQFRALVPRGLREATCADDATRYFHAWFGSAERVQALDLRFDTIGDRQHLAWRLRVDEQARTSIVEQHAFATWDHDRITHVDVVCSGFRPLEAVENFDVAAVLDGAEQGCATLTPLIRAKFRELASQQVLQIDTRDPTAGIDIASWCRLTGHVLVGTKTDGDVQRMYVRKK